MAGAAQKPVVVVGSGGHSRFVVSQLQAAGLSVAGIVDVHVAPDGSETILGVPVCWGDSDLETLFGTVSDVVYLAIGENDEREYFYRRVKFLGFATPNLVHSSAQLCSSWVAGDANIVGPCAVIGAAVVTGSNNIINSGAIIEHESVIGSHSHISLGAVLCGRVRLGDSVMVGANATVLPGIHIVSQVTVGAGAVITRDLSESGIYAGIPGARIR
jgi:UDP-N-acetylbacillosamine N-acetyltransferase